MKQLKYFAWAFACCLLAGCYGSDWDEALAPVTYGNPSLIEDNIITIAQLKSDYASIIETSLKQVTEDVKIKGRVTGNDIGGNIYSEVALDDGTGAILVCISEGGLFSYMPVGQEVLVSLKDLYIGGYGQQPEIGTPYTNKNGRTYVSRMAPSVWKTHFKLIGIPNPSAVTPVEFDKAKYKDANYIKENCGKLMVIKNVIFKNADGVRTFAPEAEKDAGNGVNRGLVGLADNNLVVRTSSYADFAGDPLPEYPVDLIGVFTRYNSTWQILIRTKDDIRPAQ